MSATLVRHPTAPPAPCHTTHPTLLLPAGTENLELLVQPGRSNTPVTTQRAGVDYREVSGKWLSLVGGGVLVPTQLSPCLCLSQQCCPRWSVQAQWGLGHDSLVLVPVLVPVLAQVLVPVWWVVAPPYLCSGPRLTAWRICA